MFFYKKKKNQVQGYYVFFREAIDTLLFISQGRGRCSQTRVSQLVKNNIPNK